MFWVWFHLFVICMLLLDLKGFHRNEKAITWQSAGLCSLFWILLALSFNLFVLFSLGKEASLIFFTAYLLETSLSVDNLFVFLSIFSFFQIEPRYQHKVLFFGVLGAFICRVFFILVGISVLEMAHWVYAIFGIILCSSAFFLYRQKEDRSLRDTWLMKLCMKYLRVDKDASQSRFFVKKNGKIYVTTLFVALVLVEASDILFAIDSIPAVLSLTSDLFLAYTSNVFAVLGLRSMYFLLVSFQKKFVFLKSAIIMMLFFIGGKMLLMPFWSFSSLFTLGGIVLILFSSFIAFKFKKNN